MEFTSIKIEQEIFNPKIVRYVAEENRLVDAIARLSESSPEQVLSEIIAICHEDVDFDFYQKFPQRFIEVVFIRQAGIERFAYIENKK